MRYQVRGTLIRNIKSVEIDRDGFELLKKSRDHLSEIINNEEKFDSIMGNYVELEEALFHFAVRQLAYIRYDHENIHSPRSTLARKIANLLSSCRLYLDGLPKHLSLIFDDSPYECETIARKISSCYDASLAYRTMEALRNYGQHRGFPIQGVTMGGARQDRGSEIRYSVSPRINTEALNADKKFKRSVIAELVPKGTWIELMPIIREYIEQLGEVQSSFRELTKPAKDSSVSNLTSAIFGFRQKHPLESSIALAAVSIDDAGTQTERVYLLKEMIEYAQYLESKNLSTKNLQNRYVRN